MTKQLGFYVDQSTCVGCKACQVACKDNYDLPIGVIWRRVIEYGGGTWVEKDGIKVPSNIFGYFTPMSCLHCQNPACVTVCPTGAMYKREEDGIVLVNQDKCIGCRYCEWACPYGAPQFDETIGLMTKCTACVDRVAEGKDPVCVAACPMRALEFGELSALRKKHGTIDALEPLPSSDITSPSVVFTAHKDAQPSGSGTGRIINLPEEI
jgi:anaerobic dimethyl sulfoxide reductase subunit B (iron-sulfur subunit)